MNSKTEGDVNRLDTAKWALALGLIGVAMVGFYYFADHSLLLRVLILVAVVAVALVIVLQTEKGRLGAEFVRDARTEVRKVVWPTRKETVQTTGIVLAMVTVVAIFLWLFDMLLGWAVRFFIGQGG